MSTGVNLCDQLRQIHLAAIDSVRGDKIMNSIVQFDKGFMKINYHGHLTQFDLKNKNVFLIGSGKAVLDMCHGFLKVLDKYNNDSNDLIKINQGILCLPVGIKCDLDFLKKHKINAFFGAKNNLPDDDAITATNAILDLIENTIRKDSTKSSIVISFISGGASALLVSPKPPLSLEEKRDLTKQLMAAGCTINELNQVRRCLSQVKGGQLACKVLRNRENIRMINFIASDVIGDPLDIIGGGPTASPQKETSQSTGNALEILNKYKIQVDDKIRNLCKQIDPECDSTNRLYNLIVVNNKVALEAGKKVAESLGYKVIEMGNMISGEAAAMGSKFAEIASKVKPNDSKLCWLGGGETVVTLSPGHGKGGRCQEMTLKFLIDTFPKKDQSLAFLAGGTDGQDGPNPISGAVYRYCPKFSKELYDEAKLHLEKHDSYTFWSSFLPLYMINTGGPTGVNVMDIYCLLKE